MQKKSKILITAGALLAFSSPLSAGKVMVNQLGFTPNAVKQATYIDATDGATLSLRKVAEPGTVVLALTPSEPVLWAPSAEQTRTVDFSAVKDTGSYAIYENDVAVSATFRIAPNVYEDLLKASLKWFYYQRASTELLPEHAGTWARAAGHPDTLVRLHSSVGSDTISAPKGWYDAGDYGKYIVNSGVTMGILYNLYEDYRSLFDTLTWNIPESGNAFPDLLDELRWNLDWMLAMQDRADGGVYHKLTTLKFSSTVMPAKDRATRYVVMKTSPATFDFAAVAAQAARIYSRLGKHEEAGLFYDQAREAYSWGSTNRWIYFEQPTGMNTGTYGDSDDEDEKLWAAVNLSMVGGDSAYASEAEAGPWKGWAPSWGDVGPLASMRVRSQEAVYSAAAVEGARKVLATEAAKLLKASQESGYGVPTEKFYWGSNGTVASQGIVLLQGFYMTGDSAYVRAAQGALDYLLGRNPLDMSYVTGFGVRSPMHPHHRPSEADSIEAPVPGMLVGGPHDGGQDVVDGSCQDYRVTGAPAKGYTDAACSYATNEVAINWNAPLAYLAGALHAIGQGATTPPARVLQPMPSMGGSSMNRLFSDGHGLYVEHTLGDGSVRRIGVQGSQF